MVPGQTKDSLQADWNVCCCIAKAEDREELGPQVQDLEDDGEALADVWPDDSGDFTCTLTKQKRKPWGLPLDHWRTCLQLVDWPLADGAVAGYNAKAAKNQQFQPLDCIVEVNGNPTSWQNFQSIQEAKQTSLQLRVQRPRRIQTTLRRGEMTWGVTLRYHEARSTCLGVTDLVDGAVQQHNAIHPSHQVIVGDLIEQVNDISGDPTRMFAEFKVADKVVLILLRRPSASEAPPLPPPTESSTSAPPLPPPAEAPPAESSA